ncbi:MAG TPA: hypothetical protein VH518_10050 [Tepidisphaeraceae bacterium]|jgi:DNA/RNA endonuclease YhcR with UshA esterase domain
MKVVVPVSLILLMSLFVRADDATTQPAVIQASDKDAITANAGKDAIVEGTISKAEWSRSGAVLNIEFKDNDQSRFMAVIFQRQRENMDKQFAGDVAKSLTGAKVRIKGKLGEYRDRPQIIINEGTQITIVEAAPSTQQS